jgi:Sulfotransferase domain
MRAGEGPQTGQSASLDAVPEPLQRRVPDFFIVGNFKSGTTALYEMLRRQPQIYMPDVKELWFFSPELRSRFGQKGGQKRPHTLDGYLSLFEDARPEQLAGEASPSYLVSETAAQRIAAVAPAARIIAIVREPASFLRSFHMQCVQNHDETETDLATALALEQPRREGKQIPRYTARPHDLLYSEHVRYVEQLRRYHEAFGAERVLVLIYDDFRRENEATVQRVLRFLDVDAGVPVEPVTANPTVRVRSPGLYELIRTTYMGRGRFQRAMKSAIKAVTPQQLRRGALRATRRHLVYGAPRPADEELMLELRRRFKGEVVALSDYLDRDLVTLWGYDAID